MTKKFYSWALALCLALLGGNAYAVSPGPIGNSILQQKDLCTGIIHDNSGDPIIGATISIKGGKIGAVSDVDGRFSISGIQRGITLHISYIGYKDVDIVWTGGSINVTMVADDMTLNEIVVVGFGSQKKADLTGSVSTVSAKDITARPVNSVVDALQGVVPGMNFSVGASGGSLNSSETFNIRGRGTIGAGSSVTPLVLIDGMEGDLSTLNPEDVDNISILKDASSSSIYGSRAAGGVILVTTKTGKAGKARVSYNNNFRFGMPMNMPEMMDSYSWALYMNDASKYGGSGIWFSDAKLEQIKAAMSDRSKPTMFKNPGTNHWEVWDANDLLPVGNTDWLKEHFTNSFSQEHAVSATGGSEGIHYYFSGDVLSRQGLLRHGRDKKNRYNLTSKVDAQLTKWVKATYSMRFTRTDYNGPTFIDNNVFYHNVCRYWPIIPTKDPNGHYVPESFITELTTGGRHKNQEDVIAQQLALCFTPVKGLVVNAELNYRINTNSQHIEWLTTYGYDVDNNPYATNNQNNSVKEYYLKQNYFNPNIWAEYSLSLKDAHNFKIMTGFQSEEMHQNWFSGQQYGIVANLPTLHTTSKNPKVDGKPEKWTTAGFFGRLNYDYLGKYLFEGNLRYDGSSRFLRNNRWNWFPSFSVGWNIARENFWKPIEEYVNSLKLRASWGKLGNQNTDSWYPFYSTMYYANQGGEWLIDGKKPNVSGEPSLVSATLTWEKSRTWEVGLDWGAFNNRLTGSFSYFQRKTYDMVGPAPELPVILGTATPKVNNLDMTSKGWDLQISWRDRINTFEYGINLILSDSKVVIDKYPNDSKDLGQTYYKGAHLGDIWGYKTVGIAKSQEEMDQHLKNADQSSLGSNWAAGDVMYADINGDHKVNNGENRADNAGDLKIIGNSTPRYNFGLNMTAAWKGIDIKVFFQGTLKRDYAPGRSDAVFWGACGINKWQAIGFKEHLDYFRDSNSPLGENLDSYYPRPNWRSSRNNYTQTRYLQNAAYCRLKNLTIGYTLPQQLTKRIYVQSLRFFVSAENLFTITNFTRLGDPEIIDARGYDDGLSKTYPLTKNFSFGMNITL